MAGDEKLIAQTFTDYIQAFQTLNPRAVLSHCAVPCVFISPQGVVVMTNPMEIEILAGRLRWQRLTMRIRSYISASHRLTG